MSTQIDRAYVNQFRANFDMLVQQMESRLITAVTTDTLNGEFGYRDQLDGVMPERRTSRHAPTRFTEVPHARRRFHAEDWEMGEMIDKQDTARMLTSPQSAYASLFAMGFSRQRDKTILDAMFADASTGKAGATTVAFPAAQQIAVDYVETGSATNSSITLGKLRRALEILGDVGADDDELYIACRRREISALLRTVEYGSYDYNTARPLLDGGKGSKRFMGLNWIVLPNRIKGSTLTMFSTDGSGHFRIPVWSKKGVLYAPLRETEIDAMPNPERGGNTSLIGHASFGAARLEEERVVEIKCHATAF
ncbi:MAG: hypothetical protein K2X74_00475 [Acetobacteraceae bacterium]|nr:hypothetical protein [Acetobacteraceae bacterium]